MVSDEISIMEKGGVPADAKLPTNQGDFRIRVFHDATSGLDHVALTLGQGWRRCRGVHFRIALQREKLKPPPYYIHYRGKYYLN